jgi:hypothetical protein
MRCRTYAVLSLFLGSFVLAGCGGEPNPGPPGTSHSAASVQQPFGLPKNLKNFKPRKVPDTSNFPPK